MMRIDMLIKEKFGLSRQKAAQLIKEGAVKINGVTALKPSQQAEEDAAITIAEGSDTLKFVSRGGLKMEAALVAFGLDLKDKVCLDIGASTGGFTDCMLQNGAKRVYAVDVGTDQLADVLRRDERVVCFENTNITDFVLPEPVDIAVTDVSFVSLAKILPEIDRLVGAGRAMVLVKPQFEAGRQNLSKKGIVRDFKVHKKVIENVIAKARECGLFFGGIEVSPIKGGDGNTEYLLLLTRQNDAKDIKAAVEKVTYKAKRVDL